MSDATIKKVFKTIEEEHDLTIRMLGDTEWPKIERIPSGSLALDLALGGGWPRSRIVEIFGLESGGKTLLALHTIAQAQRLGGRCAFVDAEFAFDPIHASNQGVDVKELALAQPDYGEQALEAVQKLSASNEFDVIVIDSVPRLTPKEVIDSGLEEQHMAKLARLMSVSVPKIVPLVGQSKTLVIFINQLRKSMHPYGNPFVKPGGMALDFYSSAIIQVKKVSKSEREDPVTKYHIGHNIHAKVTKNKTAPPMREATIPILYSSGIILAEDFVHAAKSKGLISEGKNGFKYIGKVVQDLEGASWSSMGDLVSWLTDPSCVENVALLRREIVGI